MTRPAVRLVVVHGLHVGDMKLSLKAWLGSVPWTIHFESEVLDEIRDLVQDAEGVELNSSDQWHNVLSLLVSARSAGVEHVHAIDVTTVGGKNKFPCFVLVFGQPSLDGSLRDVMVNAVMGT